MKSPVLIDTHAHLTDERFRGDWPAILDRARTAGVARMVVVATTADDTTAALALAAAHPDVLAATAGIHPNNAAEAAADEWNRIVHAAESGAAVAIGETGLDRHWDSTPFPMQEDYFARHLDLARRIGLQVVIHSRECDADMLRMLRDEFDRHGPIKGIMHSFASGQETADACLAMGLHLSFSGVLTYKNAADLRTVAARVPLDRLLVETDCPYLSPVPHRGKRNEPAFVAQTAACLAGLVELTPAELAERTTATARALFNLK